MLPVSPELMTKVAAISGMDNVEECAVVLANSLIPNNAKPAEISAFLAIAAQYNLNPITKEIYAFPNRGGIQPIVSIDGWLKIINSHPQFNGMEYRDQVDANGKLISVTCRIYRKDREHPTEMTEYMAECQGPTHDRNNNITPWGRWPNRMLRHKATIQAARYAFGFSGIIDPDEAERADSVMVQQPKPAQSVLANAEQIEAIIALAKQAQKPLEKIASAYAVHSIEALSTQDADKVIAQLHRAIQKQQAQAAVTETVADNDEIPV
ncbi:RecT family recombinase [Suttonella ornithocola]|uniref:Phage recombination protein Bet n=1 Tax=Suttonella ornithocola TaxID=279832 RepID=A0A380MRK1_9GAMM|nr:RecT family recombinase [Suttonella ornithocola]SUO95195.1 phage recombination protein Bet [Suttonella ornithocola]SUQ09759.1 phage recombination protein Bet [Suttonella ornithocola]